MRATFGHQRARWWGSATTRHTELRSAAITRLRLATGNRGSLRHELAQVAHQHQVLELGDDRGEVLERVDGLAPAFAIAGSQSGSEDLFDEHGLAVRGRAQHAQVARGDAEARQLRRGPHDLALDR